MANSKQAKLSGSGPPSLLPLPRNKTFRCALCCFGAHNCQCPDVPSLAARYGRSPRPASWSRRSSFSFVLFLLFALVAKSSCLCLVLVLLSLGHFLAIAVYSWLCIPSSLLCSSRVAIARPTALSLLVFVFFVLGKRQCALQSPWHLGVCDRYLRSHLESREDILLCFRYVCHCNRSTFQSQLLQSAITVR